MQCNFVKSWVGSCKNEADDSGFCSEHKELKCCSCGEKATHDCEETGQFVCGALLCNNCEHTIFEDGTNGGIGFNAQDCPEGMSRHCKKSEQRFTPWYKKKKEAAE